MLKEIFAAIAKNELILLCFILSQEILRTFMNASSDLAITRTQTMILAIVVALLSMVQQHLKKKP